MAKVTVMATAMATVATAMVTVMAMAR